MSLIMPVMEKVVTKAQMAMLLFKHGRDYERFRNKVKNFNTTTIRKLLMNKLVVNLAEGMRLVTDGLGGIGGNPAMRLTGSVYFIRPRTGGVPAWEGLNEKMPLPVCEGSRVVRNQPFQSFNTEVQFDAQEPMVVIAYATSYLGIEVSECWATVENHGHIALLTDQSNLIRSGSPNSTEVHPVVHITVNRLELSHTCRVTVCSMRDTGSSNGKEFKNVKPEKITFEFTAPKGGSGAHRRLLSMESSIVKEPCSTGTKIITAVKFETNTAEHPNPGPYRTFCNGTKIVNGYAPPELGCYSITRKLSKVQCPTKPELTTKEYGDCSFSKTGQDCPDDSLCINVKTPGRGIVKIVSDKERAHEDCNKECNFLIKGFEATITCPNGEKHSVVSSVLDTGCPLAKYGHLPLWICRMSFRPSVVYILFAWYFLGYMLWRVLLFVMYLALRFSAVAFRAARLRTDKTRGTCDTCGTWVPSKFHWQRHENCKNGRCPYCRMSCSNEKLKLHVKDCVQRRPALQEDEEAVTISFVPLLLRLTTVALSTMNKSLSKAFWFLGLFVIFYVCIHPVYSLKDTAAEEDLWQKEVDFVEHCSVGCIQGEDDCTCPVDIPHLNTGRRILSLFPNPENFMQAAKGGTRQQATVSKKRAIDVTAPWGTLHVSDAYSPSYSGKHISLSWTESSSSGDHVTVNGKSEAILKLEAGTGLMWEIGSPSSEEKRRVFVSILDHTQVYTSRFLYATGDRTIEPWMHGKCTGDCPDKCACTDHLCHHSEFDDFTNWRCNPTWCLSIGSGCACCALAIKEPFRDWFLTKWELEYIESPVIACVETSPDDRICQEVSAGTVLQLGAISVQFSDPSAVSQKLPKDVAVFHKMPGREIFDLSKKLELADGKTLCDIQSCTHGPAGDLQFYDVGALFSKDHINLNPLSNKVGLNGSNSWMSWSGVTSYYTCHPGNWPDCHSNGVVDHNAEAFKNLKNSGNPAVNYFFHSEQIKLADAPTLLLKGRPSYGAGQITALLDVQGLSLKALHVRPSGMHLDINSCRGCFGCSTGFTCIVRIKLTKPDSYALHLMSEDPEVVVPSVSIMVHSDSTEARELRFFAAVDKDNVCIRIKELDEDSGIIRGCSKAELEPQQAVLLENRRTLHSTSDSNCTTGYFSCVTSNAGSFFGTIGQFFSKFFGSWWTGLLVALIVAAVVLVSVFFGPQIFGLLITCCRARKGYRKLVQFDSLRDEWTKARKSVEEEKKKNKDVESYLEKLSKVN